MNIINDNNSEFDGISKRSRTLVEWAVMFQEDNDGKYIALAGYIQTGVNERPLAPGAFARITVTSPIVKVEGNTAITESGSEYVVSGPPSRAYMDLLQVLDLTYDENNPIPQTILNYWR